MSPLNTALLPTNIKPIAPESSVQSVRIRCTRYLFALSILVFGTSMHCAASEPTTQPVKTPPREFRKFDEEFVLVLIDPETELVFGPFPYDRSIPSAVVDRAARLRARGIVLNFFLDRPRSLGGDQALAASMSNTHVVLQARMDENEPRPNPLPKRFEMATRTERGISGTSGWIPLGMFTALAADVGFADFKEIDRMPAVESYKGATVKSLVTASLSLAIGADAHVTPGKAVEIAGTSVPLDGDNQFKTHFPGKDDLKYISMIDFLNKDQAQIANRVIVFGYDGRRPDETLQTPMGRLSHSRVLYYELRSIYNDWRDARSEQQRTK